MTAIYTPQQKTQALELLKDTGGNVAHTHAKTGIPERTLYNWRRELWQSWRQHTPSPNSPKPLPQFEDDLDALTYLRQQIFSEVVNLGSNIQLDSAFTTPAQRVTLLSQLLNHLMTLDQHLEPYTPAPTVTYVFPWSAGLYVQTPEGKHGPYSPDELTPRWREKNHGKYGPDAYLEIYWGDNTYTKFEDESVLWNLPLDKRDYPIKGDSLAESDGRKYGHIY